MFFEGDSTHLYLLEAKESLTTAATFVAENTEQTFPEKERLLRPADVAAGGTVRLATASPQISARLDMWVTTNSGLSFHGVTARVLWRLVDGKRLSLVAAFRRRDMFFNSLV